MSATLEWFTAGPQTKTGTTVATCFTDLKSLIDAQSANADFAWEVSSSNLGSTPYYVTLKRKDGSAGRILVVCWTSAPAGNNANILDTAPSTNAVFIAWFPAGNVDTPSNLTASSGTVMGDDSNCVKCTYFSPFSSLYATSYQWAAASNDESLLLFTTAGGTSLTAYYLSWAGDIVVDAADNVYGGVLGGSNGGTTLPYNLLNSSGAGSGWQTGGISAGAVQSAAFLRSNYGQTNSVWGYPLPLAATGYTSQSNGGANDPTINSSTQNVYFTAVMLSALGGYTPKGMPLKLRQLAMGPLMSGLWPTWNSTGPVVQARGLNSFNVNMQGLWCLNFKI